MALFPCRGDMHCNSVQSVHKFGIYSIPHTHPPTLPLGILGTLPSRAQQDAIKWQLQTKHTDLLLAILSFFW